MEDILASIRRIIAEDQSNSLGRTGLGGLTRRSAPAAPAVAEETPASMGHEEPPLPQATAEPEVHAAPHGDMLHQTFEPVADAELGSSNDDGRNDFSQSVHAETFPSETVYDEGSNEAPVLHLDPAPVYATAHDEGEPLMSPLTGASITSSFQSLAESVVLQDPELVERVMRESMRPLLKAWLDDHLPSIVERLVRTEIERVARGGRARNA